MTNAELKAALQSRKPVIWNSAQHGKIRYKCVYAIRYTLDKTDNIIVQAELLDYNNGSITTVRASEVFKDDD
ncbi:MAG: hypothetical protein K1W18_01740 [Oscillospiraceae bacterium]